MQNYNNHNGDTPAYDYRGKRALILLRVSTPEQEKGYGWPSQEREIRKKLIEPLGLRLNEERHIIRDTYTGLEFRHRPVLERILELAQRREFDVLTTDVLDRLGRKGLERELYRMQLREQGVRILTTDPNDHADDDSLVGELIRLINGHESEKELNNTRRRSMNARRAKVEGDKERGVEPKVIGNGHRYYGYKPVLDERGRRSGVVLHHDVILVDEDGTEWTEVKVVIFVFESATQGITLRRIAKLLNEKEIPCPYVAKGIKDKRMKYHKWGINTLSRFIKQSAYWGEARFNKRPVQGYTYTAEGKRIYQRRETSEKEQLIVPVPAIVTKELAEAAQKRVEQNKSLSTRNNHHPGMALLRAGFARCGYCGTVLRVKNFHNHRVTGEEVSSVGYTCASNARIGNICKGCGIRAHIIDPLAWEKAIELINDPKEIDERVERERSADPTADRRKKLTAMLQNIREEQSALQDYLSKRIKARTLDVKTEARLTTDLHQLAKQEEECEHLLADVVDEHETWEKIQKKLDELHRECAVIRESMCDPHYDPSYEKKRELLAFLGITVIVFREGHEPRVKIECNPPDIVFLLS